MSAPYSPIAIGALDLAALLCSRVCHDLISPVGAIVNGLEVMDEDKDEETKVFALDLIKKSANQASAKLRFGRRPDRSGRRRKGGAWPPRRRQDHDNVEPAPRIAAEEPR